MKLRFLFILAITQFMAVSAQLKEFSLDNLMPGGKTYARIRAEKYKATTISRRKLYLSKR